MTETSYRPNSEPTPEVGISPALSTREKIILQKEVMESYGIHHDKEHPGNSLSMKWIEGGAATAFSDLLEEKNLTPEDIKEVEQIKLLARTGNLDNAVKHCHTLLSKKFKVQLSLGLSSETE